MIKKLIIIIFILFINITRSADAYSEPLSVPNNKFGIHILDEHDLDDASVLVNSSGGDWGYVTIVIRKDERDVKRWQDVFDKMRRLHLIPIVRIATIQTESGWEKPNFDEIDGWVSFLNELNWVIQNRYIIIGNEPNHASEWGGTINPEEYAQYLKNISVKLKEKSSDFYILPAGLDASAPNGKDTLSEDVFLRRMIGYDKNIFENIDGWSSHSYPNPGFSGTQDDKGRGTVETFKWELNYLESLGVNKTLPVFITETGWKHDRDGLEKNIDAISETTEKLVASYEIAWKDERIVAITPFLLNYQAPPFDVFSWKKPDGSFYEIYEKVKNLPKTKGNPVQLESVNVLAVLFPPIIPGGGHMTGLVEIKNEGQNIWIGDEVIYTETRNVDSQIRPLRFLTDIEPGEKALAVIKLKNN